MFGGTWSLRSLASRARPMFLQRLLLAFYYRSLERKGSWISHRAVFDGIPCFPHGYLGVFVSAGARIGVDCVIYQHVTIGSNTLLDSGGFGAPHIGDRCVLGAGAKVIGRVVVGTNVRVGANTVVTKDVPDNSVVVSGDQKIITKERALDNRFYHRYRGAWRAYSGGQWASVTDADVLRRLEQEFGDSRPSC